MNTDLTTSALAHILQAICGPSVTLSDVMLIEGNIHFSIALTPTLNAKDGLLCWISNINRETGYLDCWMSEQMLMRQWGEHRDSEELKALVRMEKEERTV